jgi:hypothetical protein
MPAPEVSSTASSLVPALALTNIVAPPFFVMATGHTIQSGTGTAILRPLSRGVAGIGAGLLKLSPSVQSYALPSIYRGGTFVPNYPIFRGTLGAPSAFIQDDFTLTLTQMQQMIHVITDVIVCSDMFSVISQILQSLSSAFSMEDLVGFVLRTQITDTAHFHDVASSNKLVLLAIIDYMNLVSTEIVESDVLQLIASIFALRDVLFDSQLARITDSTALSSTIQDHITAYAKLLDNLRAAAVPVGNAMLMAFLTDGFNIDDTQDVYYQITQAFEDGMVFGLTINTGADIYSAWVMSAETKAMRSYSNYPFNSYCQIGDQYYGACASGIYQMGGSTDNGQAIMASIRTGLMNFGTYKLKRIDRAYLGYTSTGILCMRVTAISETGQKVDYTYSMERITANDPRENRIQIGRGTESVYFAFEFNNDLDGSMFNIYDFAILPMPLTGRVK